MHISIHFNCFSPSTKKSLRQPGHTNCAGLTHPMSETEKREAAWKQKHPIHAHKPRCSLLNKLHLIQLVDLMGFSAE